MRELFVETRSACDEEGTAHSFDYYIVIDQMEVRRGFACESYGVKIAPTEGGAAACVPHITTNVSRIDALVEMLQRNIVTPASLDDVVADWL